MIPVKCEEALRKINDYIAGTLSCKETEAFIAHIKNCPECYDELETYYTISEGIKYLETENPASYNIPRMLKMDLENRQKKIRRHYLLQGGAWLVLAAFCAVVVLALYFR